MSISRIGMARGCTLGGVEGAYSMSVKQQPMHPPSAPTLILVELGAVRAVNLLFQAHLTPNQPTVLQYPLTLYLVELGKVRAVNGLVAEHAINGEVLGGAEALLQWSNQRVATPWEVERQARRPLARNAVIATRRQCSVRSAQCFCKSDSSHLVDTPKHQGPGPLSPALAGTACGWTRRWCGCAAGSSQLPRWPMRSRSQCCHSRHAAGRSGREGGGTCGMWHSDGSGMCPGCAGARRAAASSALQAQSG